MSDRPTMSRCGQMHHLRRPDVLTFYLDVALRETSFTLEDFALALAEQVYARIPGHARTIDIELPDARAMSPVEYAKAIGRLRKRVQRYVDGTLHFPCELEEAWSYALPLPYGERCRHELAWRYGFLGVMSAEADPCPDGEILGRLLSHTGVTTTALARALMNQHVDYEDLEDGEIEADLAQLQSAVASIQAHVRAVRARGPLRPGQSLSVVPGGAANA